MLSYTVAALAALSVVVTAAPSAAVARGTTYNAGFDDLTVTPGTGVLNVPPTPYKGLTYSGISTQSDTLDLTGGLAPHTAPNTAFFSTLTMTTTGDYANVATASDRHATFHSMYVGCSINAGALKTPEACTIVASAELVGDVRKSTTFNFEGSSTAMEKVVFPGIFQNVKRLTFVAVGGTRDVVLATSIDNLDYTIYSDATQL